ncbi:hypothetical protein BGX30_008789 [Mortierella sp. GBA39]|nr:hypothetical protein BGX30_008789 [Mortierella sp. GBA39]
MAPPNNNPSPMSFSQNEDNGCTTVVRPKKRYFNSNNNNSFSDNKDNKDNNKPSSSWIPTAVPPVPIHGPTSATTSHTSYPNSRLWNRASLSDDNATLRQPATNTNTNNSAPILPVASCLSNEKNRDKNDDDQVMSTTSASSWGSWGSDNSNSSSSFSRSWSYDSRRRSQGQYSTDSNDDNNNNHYHNNNNNNNNHYHNNNNNNHYHHHHHNNNNHYHHHHNNNNNNNKHYRNNIKHSKDREYIRDVNIFLNYVREVDPVPVPLSDRYDGGSIHDLDNRSGSSIEDLIKDGFDDSNENHWLNANTMVLKDKFPKAHFHVLVMPTRVCPTFDDLICDEGVMIVKQLVERAEIIIARESKRSPHLRFKMGFHALPSMTQVHMHVISTDMDSDNTYIISVYNSYSTESFLTPNQVIRKIESKWKVQDLEFLTMREKKFYEGWIYRALPSCLLCPLALTGAVERRLRGQKWTQKQNQRQIERQRQKQARSSHKHADPDMDAVLHKTAVEIHDGSGIVTATTISTSLVPDAVVKNMETQPSSTGPTATVFTAPAASQLDVWKSTITIGDKRISWDDRYTDFALLRQHLREHYLEQKRMYCSSSSSLPPLSPLSLSTDHDLDNHDRDPFHDLSDDQSITFTAQNTCDDDDDDDNSGHEEDEDVLSDTTVPLLLIHGALDA